MLKEQQMKDTDAIRAWLVPAVDAALKRKATKAEIAAACGASPQALAGWLKTGRITKANLKRAEAYFGTSPSFTSGEPLAAGEPAAGAWPFTKFSRLQIVQLPPTARELIEDHAALVIKSVQAHAAPPASGGLDWRTVAHEVLESLDQHGKRQRSAAELVAMIDAHFAAHQAASRGKATRSAQKSNADT